MNDAVLQRSITIQALVKHAFRLRSEHGENPEYDRALVELVSDAVGLPVEEQAEMAKIIGIVPTR